MVTSNLVAIYYAWYPDNWMECVPADQGNINACPGGITVCPIVNDHKSMFPNRWAGKYKINVGSGVGGIDGVGGGGSGILYSSTDENVIRWQLELMKRAGIGVIAFSYWGSQKPITVSALDRLFGVLNSSNNPYPEIKVSIYYEDAANRSVNIVESDIDGIIGKYGNSSYFYKINSKPVFWIYGNNTLASAQKWNEIRLNKNIYINQKEFDGWSLGVGLGLADDWHQYAPANRYVITEAITGTGNVVYTDGVSAGFDRYHACARLLRCDVTGNYSTFENALIRMKNSGARHHILFWNEWQENSGIEPATRYSHIEGSYEIGAFPQEGSPYGNVYIDLIAKYFNGGIGIGGCNPVCILNIH